MPRWCARYRRRSSPARHRRATARATSPGSTSIPAGKLVDRDARTAIPDDAAARHPRPGSRRPAHRRRTATAGSRPRRRLCSWCGSGEKRRRRLRRVAQRVGGGCRRPPRRRRPTRGSLAADGLADLVQQPVVLTRTDAAARGDDVLVAVDDARCRWFRRRRRRCSFPRIDEVVDRDRRDLVALTVDLDVADRASATTSALSPRITRSATDVEREVDAGAFEGDRAALAEHVVARGGR